jgi:hypothetical protein
VNFNDKERSLLLVAIAHYAVRVRECIATCERDMPGLPPAAPGVLADYREDLAMLDRLFRQLQVGGLA